MAVERSCQRFLLLSLFCCAVVCSLSLSLFLATPLLSPSHSRSLSLPSASSTGQRSSCRWSWLSWNCRATFPVVLSASCSILFALMTALLPDRYCSTLRTLPSGRPASSQRAHISFFFLFFAFVFVFLLQQAASCKYVFVIQVEKFPPYPAEMSRRCKVGRNPSVGKVEKCV